MAHPELSKLSRVSKLSGLSLAGPAECHMVVQLSKDYKEQECSEKKENVHHDHVPSKIKQDQEKITKIKRAIESHGNPIAVEVSSKLIHALEKIIVEPTEAMVPDHEKR